MTILEALFAIGRFRHGRQRQDQPARRLHRELDLLDDRLLDDIGIVRVRESTIAAASAPPGAVSYFCEAPGEPAAPRSAACREVLRLSLR